METEMQTPEDTIAAGAEAMGAVMAEYPDLTDFGFGVSAEQTFDVERLKLTEDRSLSQFMRARQWLRKFPKTKTLNRRAGSSYGLKHVAAHSIGYVTNGVFIAAAAAEGFTIERITDSPNAWFNISTRAQGR